MVAIRRFEDIEAWKKARELTRLIYAHSKLGQFSKDFGLKNQIRRASVSVMSNIAEGYGRGGNKEFVQFLSTARGSVSEVQAQLYVALDAGHIDRKQFNELFKCSADTNNLINGFIRYLSTSKMKGSKFKKNELLHQDDEQ